MEIPIFQPDSHHACYIPPPLILQFIPTTILQIDGVVGFSSAPEDRVVGGGESSVVYCIVLYWNLPTYLFIYIMHCRHGRELYLSLILSALHISNIFPCPFELFYFL